MQLGTVSARNPIGCNRQRTDFSDSRMQPRDVARRGFLRDHPSASQFRERFRPGLMELLARRGQRDQDLTDRILADAYAKVKAANLNRLEDISTCVRAAILQQTEGMTDLPVSVPAVNEAQIRELQSALAELPLALREALVSHYCEGMDAAAACTKMGVDRDEFDCVRERLRSRFMGA